MSYAEERNERGEWMAKLVRDEQTSEKLGEGDLPCPRQAETK
jgi:hypothetical protein